MFCENCGIQLAEATRFCPSCGTKIEAPPVDTAAVQSPAPPPPPPGYGASVQTPPPPPPACKPAVQAASPPPQSYVPQPGRIQAQPEASLSVGNTENAFADVHSYLEHYPAVRVLWLFGQSQQEEFCESILNFKCHHADILAHRRGAHHGGPGKYRGRLLLKAVMRRGLHRKSVFQGRFYEWANFAKAAAHR